MIRPILIAMALALTGCLVGEIDGIPCSKDDECASDSFCDIGNGVCIALSDTAGPPDLEVTGVETPDGKVSLSAVVEREVPTRVLMHVRNRGLSPAEQIEPEFSEYHAVHFVVDLDTIPEAIDGGKTKKIALDVLIDADSSTPVPIDWFLSFSGRTRRGVFNFAPPRPVAVPPD